MAAACRVRIVFVGAAALLLAACGSGQRRVAPSVSPPAATPSTVGEPSAGPVAAPPTSCTVDLLPLPDGAMWSEVNGGDRGGRYLVGRSADQRGRLSLLIWRDGRLVTAAEMPGLYGMPVDINGAGIAIGNSASEGGVDRIPWRFDDGAFAKLTLSGAGRGPGTANAIGDQGTIVGARAVDPFTNMTVPVLVPVKWAVGDTAGTEFGLDVADGQGSAVDVDADGTIVGTVTLSHTPQPQASVWSPDGTMSRLPLPMYGGRPAMLFRPTLISSGVVVGYAALEQRAEALVVGTSAVLDLRTRTFTFPDPDIGSSATAMNRLGWYVTGSGATLALAGPTWRASLPAPPDAGAVGLTATTISDDGRTLGGASGDSAPITTTSAVMWRCA